MSSTPAGTALGDRVSRRRAALGLSQQSLAEQIGMKQQGIVSIESGHVQRPRKLLELAESLRTTQEWLLTGRGDEVVELDLELTELVRADEASTFTVPVMGFIGAGATVEPEYEQVPPEGLDSVTLPFAVPDNVIAFRVRGDSMIPSYRDGDAVLVFRDQTLSTESYVGEEAAVRTSDGRRYLKEIQFGKRRNSYNLHSYNARLISNVQIDWVGEIYLVVRASTLRRAARRKANGGPRRALVGDQEASGTQ